MCIICEGSGRENQCPCCQPITEIPEGCSCEEGVYFFIKDMLVSEDEYNNHPIEEEKRYEYCDNCN